MDLIGFNRIQLDSIGFDRIRSPWVPLGPPRSPSVPLSLPRSPSVLRSPSGVYSVVPRDAQKPKAPKLKIHLLHSSEPTRCLEFTQFKGLKGCVFKPPSKIRFTRGRRKTHHHHFPGIVMMIFSRNSFTEADFLGVRASVLCTRTSCNPS